MSPPLLEDRSGRPAGRSRRTIAVMLMALVVVSCTTGNEPATESSSSVTPPAAQTGDAAPAPAGPCDGAETQAEMTQCWADEQRTAERRTDEAMAKAAEWLRLRDEPGTLSLFQDAHAAWGAYRDAHCRAVAAVYAGGSMAPMQEAHCRAELAGERTRALETILADANQ